ncbi:MAG: 1,4-dihydroxy-2-naphthoate octaprenyltransferase [candidate division KSB1 bacterium]|nr:1,4-dihydroxy-2-naphthoate octaprenyltransferase [candidate division KSB1 bacterium]
MNRVKVWLQEIRMPFFTGTIVPIVLGAVVAFYHTDQFHWGYFLLTLLGGILLHAAANVSNDYFDHLNKGDDLNKEFVSPFTGGSRVIQKGLLSPKEVLIGSLIFFLAGSLIGVYLAYKVHAAILLIGFIGVVSAFFYTAPPLFFVSRGIGEVMIFLNFGVLMTLGSYFVQTASFSWLPVVASLPVAFLISAILYINEFQDYKADKAVGKNHIVVRVGRKKAAFGYLVYMLLTYISVIIGVITDVLPPWALLSLLTLPLAFKAIKVALDYYDDSMKLVPANAMTIQNHLITGLLLCIGFMIDKWM